VTGGAGRGWREEMACRPGCRGGLARGSQARSSTGWWRKKAALGAARRLWQVLGEAGRGSPGWGGAAVTDPSSGMSGVRRRLATGSGGRRRHPAAGGGIQWQLISFSWGSGVEGGGGWRRDPVVGAHRREVREERGDHLGQMRVRGLRPLRAWGAGVGFGRVRPCRVVNLESSFSIGQGSEALFG
jgi:hypothetical protein